MSKRKGALRRADIPPDVLKALNAGTLESASLAEALAIDFVRLMEAIAPHASFEPAQLSSEIGIMKRMDAAAGILFQTFGEESASRFGGHASDTVRSWAALAVGRVADVTLADRLERIRPFADDRHFGVREIAWMSVRPRLAELLPEAIELLVSWTASPSPFQRRFATESTRPRGVWCAHIESLKRDPAPGLPLLEPLRADSEKYVQDSVANWLNDAAKSQPAWVRKLCARWKRESKTDATERICKRALRSLT
jgi:3-methyladenine DNA glycosylase AlkC